MYNNEKKKKKNFPSIIFHENGPPLQLIKLQIIVYVNQDKSSLKLFMEYE